MEKVATLIFDFLTDVDAIEFVRRVTSVTRAPCMRDGRFVLAMATQDELSEIEDIAHVLRGMYKGLYHPISSPHWSG